MGPTVLPTRYATGRWFMTRKRRKRVVWATGEFFYFNSSYFLSNNQLFRYIQLQHATGSW